MLETLTCKAGHHTWERERKRGVKPSSCPQHRTETIAPAGVQPAATDTDKLCERAMDLLDTLREEQLRKAEYVLEQILSGRRTDYDIAHLSTTLEQIIR